MKICPVCQKTYDDEQNFCLEDGATLTGAPAAGGGYNRSAAATEVLQGTPTAGYPGPTSPPPYSPPPPQWAPAPAQKKSPLPWILVGALVLVGVVVGIILATRDGSGTTTTGGGGGSTPSASPGRTTSTASGKTYDDPNGRFSVTLPSDYPDFKSTKQTQATLAGPVELNMLLSEKPSGAFIVGYSDFPEAAFEGRTPKKMLEDGRDGSLKNINATLEKQQDLTIQGRTGLGVYGSASQAGRSYYVRFNFILDKPRAYQVGYLAYDRADLDRPDVQAFFDSFKMK